MYVLRRPGYLAHVTGGAGDRDQTTTNTQQPHQTTETNATPPQERESRKAEGGISGRQTVTNTSSTWLVYERSNTACRRNRDHQNTNSFFSLVLTASRLLVHLVLFGDSFTSAS